MTGAGSRHAQSDLTHRHGDADGKGDRGTGSRISGDQSVLAQERLEEPRPFGDPSNYLFTARLRI